jgi:hypothetical protein
MKTDGADFLVPSGELPALASLMGTQPNSLSVIPADGQPSGQRDRLIAELRQLDPSSQSRLTAALAVLQAPDKVAHLHHTIADETISRGLLAWSTTSPDSIIALAFTGDLRRISYWSESSMSASLRKILAADGTLPDDEIGFRLSTAAVVTFLAILDHLRRVRLHSILVHALPAASFCQAEIMAGLADAQNEDFRWPLLFVEKVTPGHLVTSLTEDEVNAALTELVNLRLVEAAAETQQVRRYELTEVGNVICDGVFHDVSKAALCLSQMRPDGQIGHDVLLFVRSSFYLFMFAMAGQAGAVAAVNNGEFEEVLHNALTLRAPSPAVSAAAAAPVVSDTRIQRPTPSPAPAAVPQIGFCSNCGSPLVAGSQFCASCGTPLKGGCPGCGTPIQPGFKFCRKCGRNLAGN